MRAIIDVRMDNAAFSSDADIELARILRVLADKVESGWNGRDETSISALDANGNKVALLEILG